MKNVVLLSTLVAIVAMSSCQKEEERIEPSIQKKSASNTIVMAYDSCETIIENFYAGKNILVGSIQVTNDEANLYVTYTTEGNWLMGVTHLYVGKLSEMPSTSKGNPKIGMFPYSQVHSPRVNSYTYRIPLVELPMEECLVVAAHAEVSKIGPNGEIIDSQTAWGDGIQLNSKGSWASYFYYCVCRNNSSENSDG